VNKRTELSAETLHIAFKESSEPNFRAAGGTERSLSAEIGFTVGERLDRWGTNYDVIGDLKTRIHSFVLDGEFRMLGLELGYGPYNADLEHAERAVKVLRLLRKKLAEFNELRPSPHGELLTTEFVHALVKIFDVETIKVYAPGNSVASELGLADAKALIDVIINDFLAREGEGLGVSEAEAA